MTNDTAVSVDDVDMTNFMPVPALWMADRQRAARIARHARQCGSVARVFSRRRVSLNPMVKGPLEYFVAML